jgi:hypothetical protein
MALGDPASIKMRESSCRVARASTVIARDDLTPDDLLHRSAFVLASDAAPARRSGVERVLALLTVPFGWLGLQMRRLLRRRADTLIAIMTRVHDADFFGTSEGIETIAVPFPHLVFLTDTRSDHYRRYVQPEIEDRLGRRWRDLVDPLVGIRAFFLTGTDTGQREVVVYFGRGIFVPRPGERQIGKVEIKAVAGGMPQEPCLPGGTPAAFYRGQSALAFSPRESLAPATASLLPDEPWVFYLHGNDDRRGPPFLLEAQSRAEDSSPSARPVVQPAETPPEGCDASFTILRGTDRVAEISVVEDARPSRLRRSAPKDRLALEIVGFVAPVSAGDLDVERWWLDLDRSGYLVASALRPKSVSIVCDGKALYLYDWMQLAEGGRVNARLRGVDTPRGSVTVLWSEPGRAFGFLFPPDRQMPVTFSEPRHSPERASTSPTTYELDWLDFAGAAESSSGYSERHAVLADQQFGGQLHFPGLLDPAGSVAGCLSRASAEQPFAARWEGWKPAAELMIGSLVLRIVGPQGTS